MEKITMSQNEINVTVSLNGPYIVSGEIQLKDADGNLFEVKGNKIALCRCGQSSNKPFCDGTHARNGFDAPTKAS